MEHSVLECEICIIYRITFSIVRRMRQMTSHVSSVKRSTKSKLQSLFVRLFRSPTAQRMKDLLYHSAVLRLGIMRSEVAVCEGGGRKTRSGEGGTVHRGDEKRMTQRNGVSKEGAREASDKPHNALARDVLLDLCTRQSRWMRFGMRFLTRVRCVPRLRPRGKRAASAAVLKENPAGDIANGKRVSTKCTSRC